MSRPLRIEFPEAVVMKKMKCDNERTDPSFFLIFFVTLKNQTDHLKFQ